MQFLNRKIVTIKLKLWAHLIIIIHNLQVNLPFDGISILPIVNTESIALPKQNINQRNAFLRIMDLLNQTSFDSF